MTCMLEFYNLNFEELCNSGNILIFVRSRYNGTRNQDKKLMMSVGGIIAQHTVTKIIQKSSAITDYNDVICAD